jgi:hypothetical protein
MLSVVYTTSGCDINPEAKHWPRYAHVTSERGRRGDQPLYVAHAIPYGRGRIAYEKFLNIIMSEHPLLVTFAEGLKYPLKSHFKMIPKTHIKNLGGT